MLAQRRGRWASIEPTLGQCLLFAGKLRSEYIAYSVCSEPQCTHVYNIDQVLAQYHHIQSDTCFLRR